MLFNMMKLSQSLNQDFSTCERMLSNDRIINRCYAIEWMKKILGNESPDFVDMSVQIFDRFITLEYAKDVNCLADTKSLSLVAACSVLLSMKMLDSTSYQRINMGRFHAFDTSALINCEVRMLCAINCTIYPLCTPRSFVSMIVKCCPPPIDVDSLLRAVDDIMDEFDELPELLLFAPSTIAISVILLAFSQRAVNCDGWLQTVPDFCLPTNNPLFRSYPNALNIEKCVDFLVALPRMQRILATPSPTGVAYLSL